MVTTYQNIRVRRGSLADFQTSNMVFEPGEPLHVIDAMHNDWLSGDGNRDFNTLWSDAQSIPNRAKASADSAKASAALAESFTVPGYRAAAFGDSITATTNDYVNNTLSDSWFTYMLLASNGRLRYAGNYAQGGTTTTQILAQMRAVFANQYLTRPFDVAFIDAGTNDNLDGNSLPNPAAANIKAMVDLCRANGVKPILCTLQPAGVIGQLGAPANAPTVAATTGGTLAAGTYFYAYTRTNFGETPIGPASAAATLNAAGSVVVTMPADKGATYTVYRSTTGAAGSWQKVATLGFVTNSSWVPQQTWTDTGAAATSAPPTNDSTAGNISPAARLKNATLSRWVRRYAAVESIDLIEFATLSDGSGMWPTGGSKDGTHPTPASSRLMGQLAWAQVGHRFPSLAAQLTNDSYDPLNLAPNGCFTYVNGQGLPQYWGGYGGSAGIVRTAAPKAGFVGNAYTLQRSDATPYYDGPNGITTGWSVGDRLLFGFKLQTDGVEAANAIVTVGAKFTGATAAPSSLGSLTIGGDVGPSAAWFEEIVPAGTTQIGISFSIANAGNIGSGAPAAKASLGQVTVYNATTGKLLTP